MDVIADILRDIRPEFDFGMSDDFHRDGLLDSFDMVMLVAELEKRFGIAIRGTDILPENFRNLTAIRELVERYGVEP